MALVRELILGAGSSYVMPAENVFRISKSEGPRFALGLADGTREFASFPNRDPAEAVSIECDHVYEASA